MKKIEMLEIMSCRENVVAFLHHSEIKAINTKLADGVDVDKKSFEQICSIVLDQYENNLISNKKASAIYEILANANKQFKIEKFYRDAYGAIYKYSPEHRAYLFYQNGGKKELDKLITENGRFV